MKTIKTRDKNTDNNQWKEFDAIMKKIKSRNKEIRKSLKIFDTPKPKTIPVKMGLVLNIQDYR